MAKVFCSHRLKECDNYTKCLIINGRIYDNQYINSNRWSGKRFKHLHCVDRSMEVEWKLETFENLMEDILKGKE